MLIARVVLAVLALVADFGVQFWADRNVKDGYAIIGGMVVSEQLINLLQILLLIAAVLFLASAVLKFARMLLTGLALVALVGGGIAVFAIPDDELDWVRENGCRETVTAISETAREACNKG